MGDHLGQQRVESRAGAIAGVAEAVGAHAGTGRRFVGGESPAGRADRAVLAEGLHVDARLDGVPPGPGDLRIVEAEFSQRRTLCKAKLCLDDVDAGDFLRHGVLDLQPRIGLDEHERPDAFLARNVHQELEGAEVGVAFVLREPNRGVDDRASQVVVEARRRGDFDYLLVAALDAALTLTQVSDLAVLVAEDLNLDMAGPGQELLDIDICHAERGARLRLAALVRGFEVGGVFDDARAPTAASRHRLDDHRAPVQRGQEVPGFIQRNRMIEAFQHRHARRHRRCPGPALVAEEFEMLGLRAHEFDSRIRATLGEARPFRQESVTRVNRTATRVLRGLHDGFFVQVRRRTDTVERAGFVGRSNVQAGRIVLGMHGDRAQA